MEPLWRSMVANGRTLLAFLVVTTESLCVLTQEWKKSCFCCWYAKILDIIENPQSFLIWSGTKARFFLRLSVRCRCTILQWSLIKALGISGNNLLFLSHSSKIVRGWWIPMSKNPKVRINLAKKFLTLLRFPHMRMCNWVSVHVLHERHLWSDIFYLCLVRRRVLKNTGWFWSQAPSALRLSQGVTQIRR